LLSLWQTTRCDQRSARHASKRLQDRDSGKELSEMQTVTRDYTYVLGQSNEEIARLIFQSSFLNELTRQPLLNAGIGPGMRVLDIGSGAGDVALLAADLVGPAGEVVGIDLNDRPLEIARARAAEARLTNVSFVQGDLHEMAYDGEFDV